MQKLRRRAARHSDRLGVKRAKYRLRYGPVYQIWHDGRGAAVALSAERQRYNKLQQTSDSGRMRAPATTGLANAARSYHS